MKLQNITNYQKIKIAKNLNNIFEDATSENIYNGSRWYSKANIICQSLSQKYDIPVDTVAKVMSVLSPRNKWERNILDAKNVIIAHKNNIDPENIKVCTFSKNKFKAFNILSGKETIKPSAKKTYSFYKNILLDNSFVTIDLWHLRACFGKTIESGLTPLRYDQIKDITIKLANLHNVKGYEFQAIVWEAIRK